ncbi:gliding motility-associated C-terminal domain-containing protein [Dyadobacter fanqingshengii]|uniref:Gliding motility-associated C-terminal domain-containing protein n=1 Tax=Dyadobacter fanqingshengii TaxID=2906443 RepID=A0A9X1TBH2_9BACT|nr:gliding motility-associated C-terminal domain-containing protein [Dyadobacter fanqingshengii]MCF0042846.1 gliding motility-associated C-terminal domain-containing protein [Dyadobacter fanqingshengii]USJ35936.1 gliding motility-associated C-terminal domain-containing protein [Dyadobacter fanqingshengii]
MFNRGFRIFIVILFFVLICKEGIAKNIIGGYLQMKTVDQTIGRYIISLKLHIDETNGSFSDNEVNVRMIKKSNGSEVESFKLVRTSSQKISYDKSICIGPVEINTIYANYEISVSIYPPSYSDPEGYYLEWTDCCRSPNIANIEHPENYTTTLRTLFPPIMYNNYPFHNSTPAINELTEFFICFQQPFTQRILASDSEGDKLKYSLVNLSGHHSSTNSPLEWKQDYSAANAIPGNPALTINSETGLLTVTPREYGYFTFAVCVEEFRGGRRLGAAIREYALFVLGCSPETMDRNVYLNNAIVSNATICSKDRITLTAKTNTDLRYQWMRNGKVIPGATSSSLEITQEGDYSFNIYRSGNCVNTVESKKVHVTGANSSFKLEKHGTSTSCEQPSETVLVGPKDLRYSYNWFKNSSLLTNKSNSLTVSEPGNYWAIVESPACKLLSDTIAIEQSSNSNVKVEIEPILPVCGNDDKPIPLVGSPVGGVFQGPGIVDGVFYPKQAGVGVHELIYTISLTAPCPSLVAKQTVQVQDSPKFDLSEEICVTNGVGFRIGIKDSSGLHYEWLPRDGLNESSISMPLVTTDIDRLYTLTVSNAHGCKTSKEIKVKICSKFFIPDAFTPNRDGINDTWELKGIDKYPDAEVTIYNRWGNIIFHSKGYPKPFDGSSNQPGVYPYKVKLDNVIPPKTGTLMLIR